jgi:hypothetical protein
LAAQAVAVDDPCQAARLARAISDETGKSWVLAELARSVAASDPRRAERIALRVPIDLVKAEALVGVGQVVEAGDPGLAARLFTDAERVARSYRRELARSDPNSAESHARAVPDELSRAWALVEVAQVVAVTDPRRAVRLLTDAQRLAGTDREPVCELVREAAAGDVDQAARMAGALSDEMLRAWALVAVAQVVVVADPGRAGRLLADVEGVRTGGSVVGPSRSRSDRHFRYANAYEKVMGSRPTPAPAGRDVGVGSGSGGEPEMPFGGPLGGPATSDPQAARVGRSGKVDRSGDSQVIWEYRAKPKPIPDATGTARGDTRAVRTFTSLGAAPVDTTGADTVTSRPGPVVSERERELLREVDHLERQRERTRTREEQQRIRTWKENQPPTREQLAPARKPSVLARALQALLPKRFLLAPDPGKDEPGDTRAAPTPWWRNSRQDWAAIGDTDSAGSDSPNDGND